MKRAGGTKLMLTMVVGALLVLVAACSGSDDPGTATATDEDRRTADETTTTKSQREPATTTTTTEPEASGSVRDYFAGISASTATDVQRAVDASEPGSPAALYARYLLEGARSQVGGVVSSFEMTPDGVEVCEQQSDRCYMYTDIKTNDTGHVVTFTINDRPLGEVIIGAGAPIQSGTVTVTRVLAYRTAAGGVFTVVDINNGGSSPIQPGGYSAAYIGADGRQVGVVHSSLTAEISPGATATDVVGFELAELGGHVRYPIYDNEYNELLFEVPL